jgi:hypothetical protein
MTKPTEELDANCPHCHKPLGIEAVSKLMKASRFSFTMKPQPGEFLAAATVGGCIESLGELMDASGEAMGVKSRTIVDGMSYGEDGTIKVEFLITRVATPGEEADGDERG